MIGHFHAVRFYESEARLCRIVAGFLGEGLAFGQPALVMATPEHAQGIIAELRAREIDIKARQASGDLVILDAREVLDSFMMAGMPDSDRFQQAMTTALWRARRVRTDSVVRTYGEMVDLLWSEGRDVAAIHMEMLWNRLARTANFALMCAYAMGNFYKDASVQDICRLHTHLVSADGTPRLSEADSLLLAALKP